ncbi:MAG: sigma factor-like helix-turn-helix DNA-binding protein [Planctomycetota bacterium]
MRIRALGRVERRASLQRASGEPLDSFAVAAADPESGSGRYLIAGRRVPLRWARPCLQRALTRLSLIDRQLLLGFYEGFCCAELAARCGRTEQCVKTRIHRARRRVQEEIEASVRAADDLDES